jgi:hypothetical protein
MKKYIISTLCLGLTLLFGCETESLPDPIDFTNLEKGGYMRTVLPFPVAAATFSVKVSDMANTKLEAEIEAVTPESGALFSSYELVVRHVSSTGTILKADTPLKTLQASAFAKDAKTGYPRLKMTITGKEAQDALSLTAANLVVGSRFEVRGTMVLSTGQRFNATNTGANITGGAFYSSPFLYRINLVQ